MQNTFIIAEAGVNHNGDISLALKMIDAAKKAKVDAIKFQTFKSEKLVVRNCEMAEYQKNNLKSENSQLDMLKKLEISFEDFKKIKLYCEKVGILFLSTPFDSDSLNFLVDELEITLLKVSSGDLTNIPFLNEIALKNLPVILSTGMANLDEIAMALQVFHNNNMFDNKISVLHCTSNYPTPYNEVNLNAMLTIRNEFKLPVGYSDHTLGIEVPIAAVSLGAEIIEKHFTLDKLMEGPDHSASLNPFELTKMVKSIRNIEEAFGDGVKIPNSSEKVILTKVRKSLVINKIVKRGHIISKNDLVIKRPGSGIEPRYYDEIIGKIIKIDLNEDEVLKWEYFRSKE